MVTINNSRVTIRDVARRAGVSPSLVSRILRGHDSYATEETRDTIRRAAEELAYEPSAVAQRLRSGRAASVGVLFHRLPSYRAFAPILAGLEQVLRAAGYGMLVSSTDGAEDELAALRLYRSQQVAGLLVVSNLRKMPAHHLTAAALGGLPLVAINRWFDEDGDSLEHLPTAVPRVHWDQVGGARTLAEHLLSLGHRRFALVNDGPAGSYDFVPDRIHYRQRFDTITHSVTAAGCPLPERYLVEDVERGTWRDAGVTAFCGVIDDAAADTIHALAAQGIAVPRDVSVAGFIDHDIARRTTPHLTTVRLPFEEAGRIAAQKLLKLLDGEAVETVTHIPCALVERESCGPVGNGMAAPAKETQQ